MYSKIVAIELQGLFGRYDLVWRPTSGVNVLAGGNGSGKSTLLRSVVRWLRAGDLGPFGGSLVGQMAVQTDGAVEVVTNFDEALAVGRFDFSGVSADRREAFCDLMDRLMGAGGKEIDRARAAAGELVFVWRGEVALPFEVLSSGEQAAVRLFYHIMAHPEASVLVLDEPEISLQMEWQRVLLAEALGLSPHLQILVATHSPAVVMDGWVDRVVELSTLIK